MAVSPVYRFDDNDKDIAFLKENWGDNLKDFYLDADRPYWPGTSAEFGGFDNIDLFIQDGSMMLSYYAHLQKRVDKLLSSWTSTNRSHLRDTIATIAHHSNECGDNPDKVARAFRQYNMLRFSSLEKASSTEGCSIIQFRRDTFEAHSKLIELSEAVYSNGEFNPFSDVNSLTKIQPYHFMAATADFQLHAAANILNSVDMAILKPSIYLMVLTAEDWYLKHQGKTRDSYKGGTVKSPDKFIISEYVEGNTTELANLQRDLFLKGCIYNLTLGYEGLDKAGVRKILTFYYESYVDALPDFIQDSMSDKVRNVLSAKRWNNLLNELQESGSLVKKLSKIHDKKLALKFIERSASLLSLKLAVNSN